MDEQRGPGLGGEVWCAVSQEGASQRGRPSGLVPPRGGQAEPPSQTTVRSCARESGLPQLSYEVVLPGL